LIRSGGRRALLHGDLAIANPHSLGSGLGSLRPGARPRQDRTPSGDPHGPFPKEEPRRISRSVFLDLERLLSSPDPSGSRQAPAPLGGRPTASRVLLSERCQSSTSRDPTARRIWRCAGRSGRCSQGEGACSAACEARNSGGRAGPRRIARASKAVERSTGAFDRAKGPTGF
jgi:hypothetical protein